MSQYSFHSSRPDGWVSPRPYSDATLRRMAYGPIQPMHRPRGLLSRLLKAG